MKKAMPALVLLIFFVTLAVSVEESDVTVIIDSDAPIINILSPVNGLNYNNASPILVNYSVIELSPDSEWYSLNGGSNISVLGEFYLSFAEGNYVLRIYANDSFGRANFSEVSFTVNNSQISCGDGICNGGESCSICSDDCGSCAPPPSGGGPSGGGNGGGGSITPSEEEIEQPPVPADIIEGEAPPEFRRITVNDELQWVYVQDGESLVLDISGSDVSYLVSFVVREQEFRLKVLSGEYNFEEGKIMPILLNELPVYMGVTEQGINDGVIALSFDKNKVSNEIAGSENRIIANFVLGTFILLLFVVIVVIIVFYAKKKTVAKSAYSSFKPFSSSRSVKQIS